MEKEAVVVIIRNECGEYLGIFSKEKGLGFPGGKIEKNETIEEAAVREVKEETNLTIKKQFLVHLGANKCGEYNVHLMVYCIPARERPFPSKEGIPRYHPTVKFITDSPYKDWNIWALQKLELLKFVLKEQRIF